MLALDFDFDAQRWTDIAALNDRPTHPDIARQIGSLEGIVESAAARVADKGMSGAGETIVITEPVHVGDVFELAGTVGSLS